MVPAELRVIVTLRPKNAHVACMVGMRQAPVPGFLIDAMLHTDVSIAQLLVSKHTDHLPLHRQSQNLVP